MANSGWPGRTVCPSAMGRATIRPAISGASFTSRIASRVLCTSTASRKGSGWAGTSRTGVGAAAVGLGLVQPENTSGRARIRGRAKARGARSGSAGWLAEGRRKVGVAPRSEGTGGRPKGLRHCEPTIGHSQEAARASPRGMGGSRACRDVSGSRGAANRQGHVEPTRWRDAANGGVGVWRNRFAERL